MKFSGFTDEAGKDLDTQIRATQKLGWEFMSLRMVGDKNAHDLEGADFDQLCEKLDAANLKVAQFGSLIGNWAKSIHTDWSITEAEINRAIPKMKALNVQFIRVMSYAQEAWGAEQYESERFDRLRRIVDRFQEEGLTAVHENCMNWGGFSAEHTLELVDKVPGLKLTFDTGNPVFQRDRSKGNVEAGFPWQKSFDFYQAIKEHVVDIHIKDAIMHSEEGEPEYTWPGEGEGNVLEIVKDLKASNYQGFISIEPHIAKVFHLADQKEDPEREFNSYVEYGQRMEKLWNNA